MDEHLASKLFRNVEYPYPPRTFRRLSLSLVDEREDDEEAQQTLDYLWRRVARVLDCVGVSVMICTHESGWAEETTRVSVDVGEVAGDVIVWR